MNDRILMVACEYPSRLVESPRIYQVFRNGKTSLVIPLGVMGKYHGRNRISARDERLTGPVKRDNLGIPKWVQANKRTVTGLGSLDPVHLQSMFM